MGDWIDEEFDRLREKQDMAQERNAVFARIAREKWQEVVDAVGRDGAKLDTKLAELLQKPPDPRSRRAHESGQAETKVVTVAINGDGIVVDKQSYPSYRVCLRL